VVDVRKESKLNLAFQLRGRGYGLRSLKGIKAVESGFYGQKGKERRRKLEKNLSHSGGNRGFGGAGRGQ